MIDGAYHRAEQILSSHLKELHQLAKLLMEKETIEAVEFYQIMQDYQAASPDMAEGGAASFIRSAAIAKRQRGNE